MLRKGKDAGIDDKPPELFIPLLAHLILPTIVRWSHCPHFTDKETEALGGKMLSQGHTL